MAYLPRTTAKPRTSTALTFEDEMLVLAAELTRAAHLLERTHADEASAKLAREVAAKIRSNLIDLRACSDPAEIRRMRQELGRLAFDASALRVASDRPPPERHDVAQPVRAPAPPPAARQPARRIPTILLVDDNTERVRRIKRYVGDAAELFVARSEMEARTVLTSVKVNVAVVAWDTLGIGTEALLQTAARASPQTHRVVLAKPDEGVAQVLKRVGIAQLLLDPADLAETVQHLLAQAAPK